MVLEQQEKEQREAEMKERLANETGDEKPMIPAREKYKGLIASFRGNNVHDSTGQINDRKTAQANAGSTTTQSSNGGQVSFNVEKIEKSKSA